MDPRQARTAKNEAFLRELNERIEEVGKGLRTEDDQTLDFRCECGDPDCAAFVSMTEREYRHVRLDNDRFAVVPGHEDEQIERVVERAERYVVVDKLPRVEPLVGADGEPDSGA